jgi:hypothetical protein
MSHERFKGNCKQTPTALASARGIVPHLPPACERFRLVRSPRALAANRETWPSGCNPNIHLVLLQGLPEPLVASGEGGIGHG